MGVKEGDYVTVEYEGRLEDGTIFDSSEHAGHTHPIKFTVGSHEVIPGFEKNVIGMDVEDEREFSIAPEDAYGPRREDLVREFPRNQMPPMDKEPEEGMVLGLMSPDGQQFHATIKEVTPETIKLDLNHPLAGKRLIFKIRLTDIKDKDDLESEKEEAKALEEEALNGANGTNAESESAEETSEESELPASDEPLVEKMEEVVEEAEEKEE